MSGFAGIYNTDGRPVDTQTLDRMTQAMIFRGPHGSKTWVDGPVGFGHTLLKTTPESQWSPQIECLDNIWIAADARIDAHTALKTELKVQLGSDSHLPERLKTASDALLILYAYRAWGTDCVEHLLGDFSFAIWDKSAQRMFAAHDQLGVRPFFYGFIGSQFVFSNTLGSIRQHPAVSNKLNDLAIADFLITGFNQEVTTTTSFADIQRLGKANSLCVSGDGIKIRQYWTLPIGKEIRFRRDSEYVDLFSELLKSAIQDRIRLPKAAISLSGGMDSTSIALLTTHHLNRSLSGYTVVYNHLFADPERHFSGLAAQAAGIPQHLFPADDYQIYERHIPLLMPDPSQNPFQAVWVDISRAMQDENLHVIVSGEGGDEILYRTLAADLIGVMHVGQLFTDLLRCMLRNRIRPGMGIRYKFAELRGKSVWPEPSLFPPWINESLSKKYDLVERLKSRFIWEPPISHPTHPEAYRRLTQPLWTAFFDSNDPEMNHAPIEFCYPFLDLRLIEYVYAIPPIPWTVNKEILRVAMKGLLPESIRLRRKTPLMRDPLPEVVKRKNDMDIDHFVPEPQFSEYVDRDRIPLLTTGNYDPKSIWVHLRPFEFNLWLKGVNVDPSTQSS